MIVRADNTLYGSKSCDYSVSFMDCINKKYPRLKVAKYATKWDTPTAVNDAKTAMSTYSDLKVIYAQWSGPVPDILAAEKARDAANGAIILIALGLARLVGTNRG